jgi:DNA polymerase/3'-5' exonuclease PolX
MELQEARGHAERLRDEMAPYCHRVEVAGSVRRGKAECRDIELVAIPRWEQLPEPGTLFESPVWTNTLHAWALRTGAVVWIKPGTSAIEPWAPKPEGKYWRGLLSDGTKLDLFLADERNFGLIWLIRTGPAEWSQAVVTHALRLGKPCVGGSLGVPTPEEADVFAYLGLQWVPPEARTGPAEVLKARAEVRGGE